MKIRHIAAALLIASLPFSAMASDSLGHSGAASAHASAAAGHSAAGGGQFIAGAVAVPLMSAGAVGQLAGEAGKEMWEIAGGEIGEPLPLAEEAIYRGPSPAAAVAE